MQFAAPNVKMCACVTYAVTYHKLHVAILQNQEPGFYCNALHYYRL